MDETKNTAKDTAKGAAAGAAAGVGLWGAIPLVANAIGFTSSGIAAGSTAASMMSGAAVANGGGVAAGSLVATMQSVGVVGLAGPVGLALAVTGAVTVGGATLLYKTLKAKKSSDDAIEGLLPADAWIVLLASDKDDAVPDDATETPAPEMALFDTEEGARKVYLASEATSKALFGPRKQLVLTQGWQERFRAMVAAL